MFIERFNRTLLHIINKPMVINGDGNWVNILNDAVITYNNNIHSTINMTPVDASNNPDKVKYTFSFKNVKGKPGYAQPKLKVGDYVRNVDKRNIFSKGYTSSWNRELFKVYEVLKTQPPTYKIEDINGEIILGNCFNLFAKLNMNTYKLNPLHYISLTGYSFDCFLKLSNVELDTIQDEQILKDFISAMRGGICGAMGDRYIRSQSQSLYQGTCFADGEA